MPVAPGACFKRQKFASASVLPNCQLAVLFDWPEDRTASALVSDSQEQDTLALVLHNVIQLQGLQNHKQCAKQMICCDSKSMRNYP